MTEAEWLTCNDVASMWLFIVGKPFSVRKVRLFGIAYCRVLRKQSTHFRKAVEFESAAELVADGLLSIEEAARVCAAVNGEKTTSSGGCWPTISTVAQHSTGE